MDCKIGGSNPEGEELFPFSKMARYHSVFYLLTPHFIPKEKWLQHEIHHTYLQREPRLRMNGPIPLLPQYTFIAWTKILPLDI
jgi:hypothetical protein